MSESRVTPTNMSLKDIFSEIYQLYSKFTAIDVQFMTGIGNLWSIIESSSITEADKKIAAGMILAYVKNITKTPQEVIKKYNIAFRNEISPLLQPLIETTDAKEKLNELLAEGTRAAQSLLEKDSFDDVPKQPLKVKRLRSKRLKPDNSPNAAGLGLSNEFHKNERKASDDMFPDLELGLSHQDKKRNNNESIKPAQVLENKKANTQKIEDMTVDDIFMKIKYDEKSVEQMEIKKAVDALKDQIDEDCKARRITLKQAKILAISTGQFLYAVTSNLQNSLNETEKHNRPNNNTLRKKLKNSINKAKNNYLSDVNQISKHSRMLTIALWGLIGVAIAGTVGLLLLGVEVSGSIATTIAIIEAVEINAFIGAVALSLTGFFTGAYVGVKNKNNDTSTILLLTLAGGALGIAAGLFTLGFGAVYLNLAGNILNTVISASKLHLAGIGLASGATFLTALSCGFWQTSNPNKQIERKARNVEDKVSTYFWDIANKRIPAKMNLEPGCMSRFLFKYGL